MEDEYDLDTCNFRVQGYDIEVKDALIAEALKLLSEKKREVVLMSYYLDMIDLRQNILLAYCNDGYDHFRKIYNDIIEEKIREGRQGIEQERYLTITIERKNFEEAKAQFATLEATIHKAFIELGAEIVPLSGVLQRNYF